MINEFMTTRNVVDYTSGIDHSICESVDRQAHRHDIQTQCQDCPHDRSSLLKIMDASNSSVWQRRKLVNAVCISVAPHSAITSTPSPLFDFHRWLADCHSVSATFDVLPVEGGDASHTVAQVQKRLDSVGCPTFHTISRLDVFQKHITIQMHIADGGPGQMLVKKHFSVQASEVPICSMLLPVPQIFIGVRITVACV